VIDALVNGFYFALQPLNLSLLLGGSLLGVLIGIIPRIRAIHGVVIFLPLSYAVGLPPKTILIFLVCIYYGSMFSGRIVDILNLSEDQSDTAITAQLKLSGYAAFCGTLLALSGLALSVTLFGKLAIQLGPSEYAILVVFAFASLSIQAGKFPLRTLVSTCLGIMFTTIGIDSNTGILRFTLGQPELYDGIELTTVAIGMFAISEIFVLFDKKIDRRRDFFPRQFQNAGELSFWSCKWCIARASIVGLLVGLLPGCGTAIARSFAQKMESRYSRRSEPLLTALRKTVATETANTAAAGGALIPMLALGIPGSGTTAILIGVLLLNNITPGPMLFLHNADIIWSLFAALAISSPLLLVFNLPLVKTLVRLPVVPEWLFAPCFISLAFVGAYSVNSSEISLLLMILFGTLGYLLQKFDYPLVPLLLGFILGRLFEDNLRRALAISGGDIGILFSSPICKILWLLALIVTILPPIISKRRSETS